MGVLLIPHWSFGCCYVVFIYIKNCFLVSCCASEEAKKNCKGAQVGQIIWSGQRDILHHRMSWPVYKLGYLLGNGVDLSLWTGSGINEGVISNCIVHHLIGFFSFPFITIVIYSYYNVLLCFPILNCSYINLKIFYFWVSSPVTEVGSVRGRSGSMVLNCQFSLNKQGDNSLSRFFWDLLNYYK